MSVTVRVDKDSYRMIPRGIRTRVMEGYLTVISGQEPEVVAAIFSPGGWISVVIDPDPSPPPTATPVTPVPEKYLRWLRNCVEFRELLDGMSREASQAIVDQCFDVTKPISIGGIRRLLCVAFERGAMAGVANRQLHDKIDEWRKRQGQADAGNHDSTGQGTDSSLDQK